MKKITILIIGAILSMGCTLEKDNGLVDFVVDYRLVESNSMYATKAVTNYKLHPALMGSKGSIVELGFTEFVEGTVKE